MSSSNDRREPVAAATRGGQSILAALSGRSTCSVDEAACVLGVGRSTAYAAAHDGSLPTLKVSNRILVPVARLLDMLGIDETCE